MKGAGRTKAPPRVRRAPWWGVAAALVLVLAVAEAALRVFGPAPARSGPAADVAPAPGAAGGSPTVGGVLHPYLGFSQRPGTTLRRMSDAEAAGVLGPDAPRDWLEKLHVNKQGYQSTIPDYRAVDDCKFRIAIFGGSVADIFATLAQGLYREALAAAVGIDVEDLEILNFAKGGFRQPQQAIALLDAIVRGIPIDVAINLDGFNEAGMGGADCAAGYHPFFPSAMHYVTLLDIVTRGSSVDAMRTALEIHEMSERARTLRRLRETSWLSHLAIARALLGMMETRAERARAEAESSLQQSSAAADLAGLPVFTLADDAGGQRGSCDELVADIWLHSSELMAAMAEQAGIAYVHVLQPNQYVPGAKSLSAEERAAAWAPQLVPAQHAASGYPVLLRRSSELADRGVRFADLSRIFSDRTETLFVDQCCHFNRAGNDILLQHLTGLVGDARPRRTRGACRH